MDNKEANKFVNDNLKGKTIREAYYMTKEETALFGWYKSAVVIEFTDGTIMIPQCDDEGNDGGALWLKKGNEVHSEVVIGTM
jgi:hypothetical protein